MSDPAGLSGRLVVVTGAAGGIGLATVRRFAASGHRILAIDMDRSRLDEASGLVSAGEQVVWRHSDLATPEECARVLEGAGPKLFALVHLAGVFVADPLDPTRRDVYDRVIAANLTNAYDMSLAFLKRCEDGGRIVLASSTAFLRGGATYASYSAAKGGIVGLARALSREAAPRVLVNALAPGLIATRMTEELIATRGDQFIAGIPLGRAGRPEEVAAVAHFLCSDDATFITGQTIAIDGGVTNS